MPEVDILCQIGRIYETVDGDVYAYILDPEEDFNRHKSPELLKLGLLSEVGSFSVFTHFYSIVKNNDSEIKPDVQEKASYISLIFSAVNGEIKEVNAEGGRVLNSIDYINDGSGKYESANGYFYIQKDENVDSTYVTAVGSQELIFELNSGSTKKAMLYTDTSPGIDSDDYNQLLDDLINIHVNALIKDDAEQFTGGEYKTSLDKIESQIERLSVILSKISKNPERELKKEYVRIPINKVRNYSARTLIDVSIGNSNKACSLVNKETYDIYEHRIIRQYLERVIQIAKRHIVCEEKNRDTLEDTNNEDLWSLNPEEQEIKEFLLDINSEHGIRKYIENCSIGKDDSESITIFGSNRERGYSIKSLNIVEIRGFNGCESRHVVNLEFDTDNLVVNPDSLRKLFIFYLNNYVIKAINDSSVVKVSGLLPEHDCEEIERDNIDGCPKYYIDRYYYKDIGKIHYKIDGKRVVSFGDFLENMAAKMASLNDDRAINSRIIVLCRNQRELLELTEKERQNNIQNGNDSGRWEEVIENSNRLLNYSFLKVKSRNEKLYLSNLFSKGLFYRDAYLILKETPRIFEILSQDSNTRIRIKAAQNLYEIWVLYGMLNFFIEKLGFKLDKANGETIEDSLGEYFANPELPKEKKFFLSKDELGMELELQYQPEFESEYNGKTYTPDYRLIVKYGKKEKTFYLDAKYKDFKQQGCAAWLKEIIEVAFYKYLTNFNYEGNENYERNENKIDGVYLIHPMASSGQNYEISDSGISYKLSHYYGYNITELVESYMIKYTKNMDHFSFNDITKIKLKSNVLKTIAKENECKDFFEPKENNTKFGRIGSVGLMPGKTEYFMGLFRMIMEHYFEVDESVCWRCGSTNVEVGGYLDTEKSWFFGNQKLYWCTDCDEKWAVNVCQNCRHRIRKHVWDLSYYRRADVHSKWNLRCPECDSGYTLNNDKLEEQRSETYDSELPE